MDIPRKSETSASRRRAIYAAVAVILILLVTLGSFRLKPAPPAVDRSTVWVDTVKRGPMLRQVHGPGKLVPEEIRWIPAVTEGRVDRILVLPGVRVQAETVLVELSNPQLQLETLDATWKLKASAADYKNLQVQLESQVLSQTSAVAKVHSEYIQAKMQADLDTELNKADVTSNLSMKLSQTKAQQLHAQDQIEEERLEKSRSVLEAQLLARRADIEQLRALAHLRQSQFDGLRVRAAFDGVLQEQSLKVGQWVTAGETLAKVVQPEHLKAELKVAETQAKDIQLGQPASVDTHNGVIPGHVTRIDPSVQSGTVTVDVDLDQALPEGARPDLSIDGTIDLEKMSNVLYTGRIALAQEQTTVQVFRLEADGKSAVRVPAKLGRCSVNSVEILQGLREGDRVILSDMSRWDSYDHVRLE